MIKWLRRVFSDKKYGQETHYAGTNGGRQGLDSSQIYVRLQNGNEIKAEAFRGGYMGPTKWREYPDFLEVKE